MMTPSGRAIALMALGGPLSLVLAVLAPQTWALGFVWVATAFGLIVLDAWLAGSGKDIAVDLAVPATHSMGAGAFNAHFSLGGPERAASRIVEVTPEVSGLAEIVPATQKAKFAKGRGETAFQIVPKRRGVASVERVFVRWRGPFGLAVRRKVAPLGAQTTIIPDLETVERVAVRLFSRSYVHGLKPLRDRGDGSEFDALTKFEQGMERRLIHWRQSARHQTLLAKEVRAERNHQLVFAIDTGRTMNDPLNNAPRLDWAINASLLLAFVALKLGDRVSLFGFNARPRMSTGFVAGQGAFHNLQMQAARLHYSTEETNHTFALASLAERLQRRSLIVMFTDFSDTTSAELMVETMARLARKHMIIFVAFRDEELETLVNARPETTADVTKAVVANNLLRERDLVIARIRRLGALVVSAPADKIGAELVAAYDLVRREERV